MKAQNIKEGDEDERLLPQSSEAFQRLFLVKIEGKTSGRRLGIDKHL